MLARGAVCRPDLARAILAHDQGQRVDPMTWEEITELLVHFFDANSALYERKFAINPVKQWLVYLQYAYPQAAALFAQIKRIRDPDPMRAALIGANQSIAA